MNTITTTTFNTCRFIPAPSPISFAPPFSIKLPLNCKCQCTQNDTPPTGNASNLKDLLSGMLDDRVEELLKKEENRELLDGLEQASRRVEMARRELAEIEKQEIEAKIMGDYINRLQSRVSEVAECQKEILEARAMVEEAERSLMDKESNVNGSSEMGNKVINQDMERLESLKAALISAVIGTLAELPISFTRVADNSQLILLPLAITFVSCALFGVTFRYAVRRDLDNFQLKSGTSAAFGFVKGLGMLGQPMELDANVLLSTAVCVSENLLIFLFAGVALDFCFKLRILSPFPAEESILSSKDITN